MATLSCHRMHTIWRREVSAIIMEVTIIVCNCRELLSITASCLRYAINYDIIVRRSTFTVLSFPFSRTRMKPNVLNMPRTCTVYGLRF